MTTAELHDSHIDLLRQRNLAYAMKFSAKENQAVFLVKSIAADGMGYVYALLSPVSVQQGATVARVSPAGVTEALWLCQPPAETKDVSLPALLDYRDGKLFLTGRDGFIAVYRLPESRSAN
jgi:hypothetical protein